MERLTSWHSYAVAVTYQYASGRPSYSTSPNIPMYTLPQVCCKPPTFLIRCFANIARITPNSYTAFPSRFTAPRRRVHCVFTLVLLYHVLYFTNLLYLPIPIVYTLFLYTTVSIIAKNSQIQLEEPHVRPQWSLFDGLSLTYFIVFVLSFNNNQLEHFTVIVLLFY